MRKSVIVLTECYSTKETLGPDVEAIRRAVERWLTGELDAEQLRRSRDVPEADAHSD